MRNLFCVDMNTKLLEQLNNEAASHRGGSFRASSFNGRSMAADDDVLAGGAPAPEGDANAAATGAATSASTAQAAEAAGPSANRKYDEDLDLLAVGGAAIGLGNTTTYSNLNPNLPFVVAVVHPILRFLQLLCENHNKDLQVSHKILY